MFELRRSLRPWAWLALGSFLLALSLPAWDEHPIGLADDAACQLMTSGPSSGQPHLDSRAATPGLPDHCVICHLQRAMAGATAAQAASLLAPVLEATVARAAERATQAAAVATRLSRAPPALPAI